MPSRAALRSGLRQGLKEISNTIMLGASISRITEYYSRHGFGATIGRARVALSRALFANRMVVFYCDLSKPVRTSAIPDSFKIDRLLSQAELSRQDFETMMGLWNPKLALRNLNERFAKGAELWIIKSEEQLAAFCWTMKGRTISPYYFPIGSQDVQLFDFYVLPKFRGGAVLWFLIGSMLQVLKAEGATRAYGDVAEWNRASLAFYRITPFRRLGAARSFNIFGHQFTTWSAEKSSDQMRVKNKDLKNRKMNTEIVRPHEQTP